MTTEKLVEPGLYLQEAEGSQGAILIVVGIDATLVQPLSVDDMRQLGSRLHSEAARIAKGRGGTLRHFKTRLELEEKQ
jgi:hypothetical protein